MKRPRITLTGVDAGTDIFTLYSAVGGLDDVELAVLISLSPERNQRYPTLQEAEHILAWAQSYRFPCAIHVCGSSARRELLNAPGGGALEPLLPYVQRIQINGRVTADDLFKASQWYPAKEVLFQWQQFSGPPPMCFPASCGVLVDGSGGRGLSPAEWTCPVTTGPVGFAGGLSAANMRYEINRIRVLLAKMRAQFPVMAHGDAAQTFWVDMESGLRDTFDHFSVERAKSCVEEARFARNEPLPALEPAAGE